MGKSGNSGTEVPRARQRADHSLDDGLEDSFPASDPIAAVQPTVSVRENSCNRLHIRKHEKSDLVELSDGSEWRIWPADMPTTLEWLPDTELEVARVADDFCSHVLIDPLQGSRVRVIEAARQWPAAEVKQAMREG